VSWPGWPSARPWPAWPGCTTCWSPSRVELGAARCFLRCPDTDRHRRFYERLGFVAVARLPRYYHGHDFVEYLREPLVQADSGVR
jgi:hypothetical protein